MSTLKTNTIQAATGTTVSIASGQVLTQPGSVIQVLQNTSTAYVATTSDSFVDVGFAITITPKLATSKILLQLHVFCVETLKV